MAAEQSSGPPAARWWLRAAPLVLIVVAATVGFAEPGLQYDEALFEHGTVQMLTSGAEPPFAHDRGSWFELAGRWWPLMVIPYVGAAQQYLLLPLFAVFGPTPAGARVLGALLAAAGILLLGRAYARWVPPAAAAAAVLILAIHPDLVLTILYDDGGFAQWMACLGVLAAALARHARRRDGLSAFLLGAAGGFSLWCRSNFIWLLAPLTVALLIVYGREAVPSRRNLVYLAAGGVAGGAPLLLYEALSRFATIRFLRRGGVSPWVDLPNRLQSLAESLLLDRNRAVIWGGSLAPWPILIGLAVVTLGSCGILVFVGRGGEHDKIGRVASLTVLGYLLFAFTSRLNVVAHHFVAILPVEAVVVVLAARRIARSPAGRIGVFGLAFAYVAASAAVVVSAARGIRSTGGSRSWSDAISRVESILEESYPRRDVYLLDWGFQNNLFVLSAGKLAMREIFASPSDLSPSRTTPVPIDPEGVYIVRAPGMRIFPAAGLSFLRQVGRDGNGFLRKRVLQRDGTPYADIYAVPGRDPAPVRIRAVVPSTIVAGRGFNVQPSGESAIAIEGSGFRASDRVFWDHRGLRTTFGDPGLMSAEVPNRLFSGPGRVRLSIRHANRVECWRDVEVVSGR